jgi:hypothetical protein
MEINYKFSMILGKFYVVYEVNCLECIYWEGVMLNCFWKFRVKLL